jgi:CubicO group peptidase (beta-lactamase class C family)
MLRKLLLLALLLAATGRSAQAQRASHVINSVPELLDSIRHIMAQEHIPGQLLVLATRDSVLYAGGLGVANVTTRQPVTAHTLFRIGSISKSFTALALLQLVAQGKINLNDEVRKIAPEVPINNPWEATDPVRVVHLLEHTAGFDDLHFNHYLNHTATDPPTLTSIAIMRAELRCRWRPGERMSYSNVGYLVAGYLLEKRSGQPYDQYVTQHLLRPLGMPDAVPTPRPGKLPQLAQGYVYADGRYVPQPPFSFYDVAAGDMNASPADMARYVQFFLHDGRAADGTALVTPASLREMETVHSTLAARSGLPTGYGLANEALTTQGKAIYQGHYGSMPGFISALGYNRVLGVGYALSNNGSSRGYGSQTRIEQLVRRFLLRQAPAAALPAPVALATTEAAAYLGHYRFAASRNASNFWDEMLGGASLVQRGPLLLLTPLIGSPDTLLATGPRTFRHPTELVASAVLTHDTEGHRVLVANNSHGQFYGVEAGFWWWLPLTLLVLSGLLMVTASLAGLIWLGYALRKRLPRAQVLPRVLPLLAVLCWLATYWALASIDVHFDHLGRPSLETMLLSLGPLAFSLCTVVGLGLLLRHFRRFRSRLAAWYLLATYGGLLFLVAVFGNYGWLGWQLWKV